MANEGFLRRWSRLKGRDEDPPGPIHDDGERGAGHAAIDSGVTSGDLPKPSDTGSAHAKDTHDLGNHVDPSSCVKASSLPTLEDAMRLTPDSDYSAFVVKDVDKSVRRMALKKLFADPHFNQPDGLDIYMADYSRADPLPAPMLAALRQAQGFLRQEASREQEAGEETARDCRCKDAGDASKGDSGIGCAGIQAQANESDAKGDDAA